MKRILGLTVVAGGVALAWVIGQRMSTDAMAIAIGVVFGVAASIPTSLLVVAAMRGQRREESRQRSHYDAPPQPQIYVVTPGMGGQGPQVPWLNRGMGQQQLPPAGWVAPPPDYAGLYADQPARRFRVVGEDEHWLEASPWD